MQGYIIMLAADESQAEVIAADSGESVATFEGADARKKGLTHVAWSAKLTPPSGGAGLTIAVCDVVASLSALIGLGHLILFAGRLIRGMGIDGRSASAGLSALILGLIFFTLARLLAGQRRLEAAQSLAADLQRNVVQVVFRP